MIGCFGAEGSFARMGDKDPPSMSLNPDEEPSNYRSFGFGGFGGSLNPDDQDDKDDQDGPPNYRSFGGFLGPDVTRAPDEYSVPVNSSTHQGFRLTDGVNLALDANPDLDPRFRPVIRVGYGDHNVIHMLCVKRTHPVTGEKLSEKAITSIFVRKGKWTMTGQKKDQEEFTWSGRAEDRLSRIDLDHSSAQEWLWCNLTCEPLHRAAHESMDERRGE